MTSAEWEIMKVIWANPNVTAKIIFDVLKADTQWALSTVKTLLSRLYDKGYLEIKKDGRTFYYTARFSEQSVVKEMLMALLGNVCMRQRGMLLKDALRKNALSRSDCLELIELLDEKMITAREELPCCCGKGKCRCL